MYVAVARDQDALRIFEMIERLGGSGGQLVDSKIQGSLAVYATPCSRVTSE